MPEYYAYLHNETVAGIIAAGNPYDIAILETPNMAPDTYYGKTSESTIMQLMDGRTRESYLDGMGMAVRAMLSINSERPPHRVARAIVEKSRSFDIDVVSEVVPIINDAYAEVLGIKTAPSFERVLNNVNRKIDVFNRIGRAIRELTTNIGRDESGLLFLGRDADTMYDAYLSTLPAEESYTGVLLPASTAIIRSLEESGILNKFVDQHMSTGLIRAVIDTGFRGSIARRIISATCKDADHEIPVLLAQSSIEGGEEVAELPTEWRREDINLYMPNGHNYLGGLGSWLQKLPHYTTSYTGTVDVNGWLYPVQDRSSDWRIESRDPYGDMSNPGLNNNDTPSRGAALLVQLAVISHVTSTTNT